MERVGWQIQVIPKQSEFDPSSKSAVPCDQHISDTPASSRELDIEPADSCGQNHQRMV
jgi:hypothetical protein